MKRKIKDLREGDCLLLTIDRTKLDKLIKLYEKKLGLSNKGRDVLQSKHIKKD